MDSSASPVRPAGARRFVVGTAGHIDHGKTALVKALTGVDTDRWEEEKRRGITIDLGFAPLVLSDELQVSMVDVPGHEGFIRNMLAGATGIDVALLVIAADEGIMPQTEEHLAIVQLLGVPRGIPVITKSDLVQQEWLELVREEVDERLRSSSVRWEPPIAVSALSGAGLEELRTALRRVAAQVVERPRDDLFRLPIDRVFALPGAGTVVTGTTWSGSVAVGDSVRLLPLDRSVRVRSIEVHGQSAERALPGRRTALALVGVDKNELSRGDVAVTGDVWPVTHAIDAAISLLSDAVRPITVRTRLRIHLGTAEVLARATQMGAIEPGSGGLARLVLEKPLVARGGDRFVIRSFSPVTTIGGGIVLDPSPPRPGPRLRHRGLLQDQPLLQRVIGWAAEGGLSGVPVAGLAVRLGVIPAEVQGLLAQIGDRLVPCGDVLVAVGALEKAVELVRERLAAYHRANPLDAGMSLQAIRAGLTQVPPAVPSAAVLDHVLELGRRRAIWDVDGGLARMVGWQPALDSRAEAVRARLLKMLADAAWHVPTIAELERELGGGAIQALLALLAREGGVEQVDQERYADPQALASFRSALEQALEELGDATPAQLRDRLGLTRKFLIPLLEWADRRGITARAGDARRLLTARRAGP